MQSKDKENVYIALWSGGKDSTYMVDELLKTKSKLNEIIFCDTGHEFKVMYEYILKMKEYYKNKYNANVTLLNWNKGKEIWDKWANSKFVKGRYIGKPRGFPFHIGMSWCTRELKIRPINRYLKLKYSKSNIFKYIGIAKNESKRVRKEENIIYPLIDWDITEDEVVSGLLERNLFNNIYKHFKRTGCFNCPKQSLKSLYNLYKYYPEEWEYICDQQERYKEMGAGVYLFKGYEIKDLIEKFHKYKQKEIKKCEKI